MSEIALLSLLWPKQHGLLKHYLSQNICVVYTPAGYHTEELSNLVNAGGGRVVELESLISPEQFEAIDGDALRRGTSVRHVFATDSNVPEPWASLLVPVNLADRLAISMKFIDLCDAALAIQPLAMLLVHEEYMQIARTVVLWAGKREIPVVHICHGANLGRIYSVIDRTARATLYGVVGKRAEDSLVDLGVEENRVIAVGNAGWEIYQHAETLRPLVRKLLCESHGLLPDLPILVLGTTWAAEQSGRS
jgi:hypothetical protein